MPMLRFFFEHYILEILWYCLIYFSVQFLSMNSLLVKNVGRRDRGVYQCLVKNQQGSAQAMAELKLGGMFTLYNNILLKKVGY